MKYIIFKDGIRRLPVIFPNTIGHIEVANLWHDMVPISAGFIDFIPTIKCYGFSESLQISSHVNDVHIIKMYNYTQGVVLSSLKEYIELENKICGT